MSGLSVEDKRKVQKPLLWIGIASIIMTFAGLTSGYVVSRSALRAESIWIEFPLPGEFTIATVFILLSSVTVFLANKSIKSNKQSQTKIVLAISLVLGFGFVLAQYLGWQSMVEQGMFFTGPESNTAYSWVYVITVLHWLHVISGIIVLLFMLVKASLGKYTGENYQGLTVGATYWHFLGVLWLYLFLFLSFIR